MKLIPHPSSHRIFSDGKRFCVETRWVIFTPIHKRSIFISPQEEIQTTEIWETEQEGYVASITGHYSIRDKLFHSREDAELWIRTWYGASAKILDAPCEWKQV